MKTSLNIYRWVFCLAMPLVFVFLLADLIILVHFLILRGTVYTADLSWIRLGLILGMLATPVGFSLIFTKPAFSVRRPVQVEVTPNFPWLLGKLAPAFNGCEKVLYTVKSDMLDTYTQVYTEKFRVVYGFIIYSLLVATSKILPFAFGQDDVSLLKGGTYAVSIVMFAMVVAYHALRLLDKQSTTN